MCLPIPSPYSTASSLCYVHTQLQPTMPGRVEDHVRLVSVKLRAGEASHRIKRKVLRSLRNAEKKEHKSAYPPTEQSYSIPDLPSRDVVKVVSNSRFVAFLLQDGRVCRIQCSSYAGSSKEFVEGKWLGAGKEPSFQVFSDAEYARQLQAQFDAESVRGRGQQIGRASCRERV